MNDYTATEPPQAAPAVGAHVDRRVRPLAWIGHYATQAGRQFAVLAKEPRSEKCSPWIPLIAYPEGWRFERDDMNRIVVTMPDGGGCVVDNVANDARMMPEEVLCALCKALGA